MQTLESRGYGSEMEWSLHAEDEDGNPVTATSTSTEAEVLLTSAPQLEGIFAENFEEICKALGLVSNETGFLSNGGRLYIDQHRNIEYATPEVLSAEEVALYEISSERLVYQALSTLKDKGAIHKFWLHKLTTDHKNNSLGNHENISARQSIFNTEIVNLVASFNVSRGVLTGAGGLVTYRGGEGNQLLYAVSPRLWVSGRINSPQRTDISKPLVNSVGQRDIGFDRYHQISGDANISPWAIKLRHALNGVLFCLLESGCEELYDLILAEPVTAAKHNAIDTNLAIKHPLDHGNKQVTAVEWMRSFAELAHTRLSSAGNLTPEGAWAIEEVIQVCDLMQKDPDDASDRVEWIKRRQFIEAKTDKDPVVEAEEEQLRYDLIWSLIGGGAGEALRRKGWGWHGFLRRLNLADVDIRNSVPPQNTRAKVRAEIVKRQNQEEDDHMSVGDWSSIKIGNKHKGLPLKATSLGQAKQIETV